MPQKGFRLPVAFADNAFVVDKNNADGREVKQPADFIDGESELPPEQIVGGQISDDGAADFDFVFFTEAVLTEKSFFVFAVFVGKMYGFVPFAAGGNR